MLDTPERIILYLPNWVGDAVMFTPTIRAIRKGFPDAQIALLGRENPAAVLSPNPWCDEIIIDDGNIRGVIKALREKSFDLAVLGPNSFRSALIIRLAGIKRRLGYVRDARGWLLTNKIVPPKDDSGRFAIIPAIDYYLTLAEYLGCPADDKRMELEISPSDAQVARTLFDKANICEDRPIVLINPGASYGPAKMYPADRFARVADLLIERRQAQIILNAAPAERPIASAVQRAMRYPVSINLAEENNSLGLLKAMVARSNLMITNDTGPRHFAAALGVPVVTIFGPTNPAWTDIYFEYERIVRVNVPCGPCQMKRCPLPAGDEYHQCMRKITPEMVVSAAEELLDISKSADTSVDARTMR